MGLVIPDVIKLVTSLVLRTTLLTLLPTLSTKYNTVFDGFKASPLGAPKVYEAALKVNVSVAKLLIPVDVKTTFQIAPAVGLSDPAAVSVMYIILAIRSMVDDSGLKAVTAVVVYVAPYPVRPKIFWFVPPLDNEEY